jgi:hypothetical protein
MAMTPDPSLTVTEPSENHHLPAPAENPPSQPPPESPEQRLARLRGKHGSDPVEGALLAAERGADDGNSFTVPPAAGGADSFSDGPVTAFCQIINVSPDEVSDKERAKITRVCRRIGERRCVDAAYLAESILMLPKSDWAGRCNWFTINPYAGGVEDVINALVARRLSGGPVLTRDSRAPPAPRTADDYEEGDEVF